MSRNVCNKCKDSPWVQNANLFINNPGNPIEQREAVIFLLEKGHCGISNRIKIESICNFVNDKTSNNFSREDFQNQILTELKRQKIVATLIYGGHQGGVFIPCNESEIRESVKQLLDRIVQELRNLEGTAIGTKYKELVSNLRKKVESERKKL